MSVPAAALLRSLALSLTTMEKRWRMGSPERPAHPKSLGARLFTGTFNYGLGQVLPPLLSFLLLPVFTTFLSPDDYGAIEIASSLAAVLSIFMRVGLPGAVTRFYFEYKHDEAALRDYLTTLVWVVLMGSASVALVAFGVLAAFGDRLTPGLVLVPHTVLILLSSLLAGNADVQRRLIQAREQSAFSLRLTMFAAVISLGLSVLMVVGLRMGVVGYLLADALSSAVLFCAAVHYLRNDLRGRFRFSLLKESLVYAAGVLPSQGIATMATLATRSIVSTSASLAAVGLFSLAGRFGRPLNIVVSAFNSAYLPVYFEERKRDTVDAGERLASVANLVWSASLVMSLGVSLVGPSVVQLVTPPRFHEAAPLIPMLVLGFQGQVLYVLTSAETFFSKVSVIVTATSLVGNAVLLVATALLAERYGAFGLAGAYVAYQWSIAFLAALYSRTRVRLPVRWGHMAVTTLLAIATYFSLSALQHGASPWFSMAVGAAAAAVYTLALHLLGDPVVGFLLRRKLKR